MGDVESSVYEHILRVSFVWPGITALNVWDMAYDLWCLHVAMVDEYAKLKVGASLG